MAFAALDLPPMLLALFALVPPDDLAVVGAFQPAALARFDARSGAPLGAPLAGPHLGVLGVAFGPDGRLYVASEGNDHVLRYDAQTGAFVDAFVADDPATPLDETGGLTQPTAVVFGPDGHLYVASFDGDEVLRYHGVTGAFLGTVVPQNGGGLNGPDLGMAFGPDGNLYVPSFWNHRVKRYDPATGAFRGDALNPFTSPLRNPREVLFLGDGTALVASEGSDQVLRFDPVGGVYLGVLVGDDPATPVNETGGLDGPVGLRLGVEAELLVTSINGGAVKRYALRTGAFLGDLVPASAAPALPSGLALAPRWATVCAGSQASNGEVPALHAAGLTSVASDRLSLGVDAAPAGEMLVVFVSDLSAQSPWFGGVLCVGGSRVGLGPLLVDPLGRARTPVSLRALPYGPGTTLFAQAVFRDRGLATGAGTSSALNLTLTP